MGAGPTRTRGRRRGHRLPRRLLRACLAPATRSRLRRGVHGRASPPRTRSGKGLRVAEPAAAWNRLSCGGALVGAHPRADGGVGGVGHQPPTPASHLLYTRRRQKERFEALEASSLINYIHSLTTPVLHSSAEGAVRGAGSVAQVHAGTAAEAPLRRAQGL